MKSFALNLIVGLFVAVSTATVAAFNNFHQQQRLRSSLSVHNNNNNNNDDNNKNEVVDLKKPQRYNNNNYGHLSNGIIFQNNNNKNLLSSFIAAAVVAATTTLSTTQPANALDLSKGAIVIQTTGTTTATNTASIDTQRLLKTLLTQRKDLTSSLNRIQTTISKELTEQQVWKELYKEIMDVEGDVVPSVKIQQPQDITQTLKDIQKGKLNLLVNGEVINIVVEPSLSKEEDDLIIRITGFKGENFNPPPKVENIFERKGPIRQKLSEISQFWDGNADYLPSSIPKTTNGNVILTSSIGSIAAIYLASYAYYLDLQEQQVRAAEDKKKAIAEKKMMKMKKKSGAEADSSSKKKKKNAAAAAEKDDDKKKKKAVVEKKWKAEVAEAEMKANAKAKEQEKKDNESKDTTVVKKDDDDDDDGKTNKEERRHRFRFWKNK